MSADPKARWHAFLEKIEARHQELIDGAREALPGLVVDADFDLQPFTNALTAIHAQCLGLVQKIDQTFSASAEAALEAADLDPSPEQERGAQLGWKLELALREAEVEISAAAAETMFARAKEILARDFKCTKCGAPLGVKTSFFRSHYVPCAFCQTTNTFEPGQEVRMVEHFVAHALAQRASWPQHRAYLEAERLRHERAPGKPSKEALVELFARQLDTYLAARVEVVPELAKDLAADRAAKLEAFVYGLA